MEKKLYTVLDAKAEAYLDPFFARTHGEAMRMFSDAANGAGEHPFSKHPEDFTLFYIGTFNVDTGVALGDNHVPLGKAIDFVEQSSHNGIREVS